MEMELKAEFYGTIDEDVELFLFEFECYAEFHGWNEQRKCLALPCCLRGTVFSFYMSLTKSEKNNYAVLVDILKKTYDPPESRLPFWMKLNEIKQGPNESVGNFVNRFSTLCYRVRESLEDCSPLFIKGLHDNLRLFVLSNVQEGNFRKIRNSALLAEGILKIQNTEEENQILRLREDTHDELPHQNNLLETETYENVVGTRPQHRFQNIKHDIQKQNELCQETFKARGQTSKHRQEKWRYDRNRNRTWKRTMRFDNEYLRQDNGTTNSRFKVNKANSCEKETKQFVDVNLENSDKPCILGKASKTVSHELDSIGTGNEFMVQNEDSNKDLLVQSRREIVDRETELFSKDILVGGLDVFGDNLHGVVQEEEYFMNILDDDIGPESAIVDAYQEGRGELHELCNNVPPEYLDAEVEIDRSPKDDNELFEEEFFGELEMVKKMCYQIPWSDLFKICVKSILIMMTVCLSILAEQVCFRILEGLFSIFSIQLLTILLLNNDDRDFVGILDTTMRYMVCCFEMFESLLNLEIVQIHENIEGKIAFEINACEFKVHGESEPQVGESEKGICLNKITYRIKREQEFPEETNCEVDFEEPELESRLETLTPLHLVRPPELKFLLF